MRRYGDEFVDRLVEEVDTAVAAASKEARRRAYLLGIMAGLAAIGDCWCDVKSVELKRACFYLIRRSGRRDVPCLAEWLSNGWTFRWGCLSGGPGVEVWGPKDGG